MEYALLAARLLLAVVFLVSSIGKLLDLAGAREAMKGFGVPENLARPASVGLIVAELAIAVFLIPTGTAWYAAIGALLLLGVFIVGIGYNMSKGNHPDCHCFGQIHSEPAGWPTLIRNGLLAAVALFIIAYGTDRWSFSHGNAGASAVDWLSDLSTWEKVASAAILLLIIGVGLLTWLVMHLLGQNGRVLLRVDTLEAAVANNALDSSKAAEALAQARAAQPAAVTPAPAPPGLPVGSEAPGFRLEGLYGETMTLDALRSAGKPLLLLFTDPKCGPCNALMPDIANWQKNHSGALNLAMISSGDVAQNRAKASEHGISQVMLQENRSVSSQYKAHGTPSAVMINPDGTIGSPIAAGAESIRQLVSTRTGSAVAAAGIAAKPAAAPSKPSAAPKPAAAPTPAQAPQRNGNAAKPTVALKPAPAVSLPDLDGRMTTLEQFKGKPTAMLFWNPGCGFCKRMADELKQWEADPPAGAPQLLMVSTGTPESNKEMGFRSTMLLDEGFKTGRDFGAGGTPSAVLIDANGQIASNVAVGSPNVMAMLRGEEAPAPAPAAPQADTPKSKKGSPAPEVKVTDIDGKPFELAKMKGKSTLLVFWNPGCGFCKRMVDELKEWEASPPKGAPQVVLVSTGTEQANRDFGLKSRIVLEDGFQTGRLFGASGTPSAVLIDDKGRIASDVAVGSPGVMALARNEAPAPAPAPTPPAAKANEGDPAPAVKLTDIDGKPFDLSSQKGKETLLVFWNPGCGFCKRMTDDLTSWLSKRPDSAPEVVLVSTGTADSNREMGIGATTLLDEGFVTGRKFGAGGTPSAVLIGKDGKVASPVAVGAQNVLKLAGAPEDAIA